MTSARKFVSDFYEHVLGDADTVSRVALATHELLENVIKYSSDGRSHLEIELMETSLGDVLRIRARNRTTVQRAGELKALVSELEASTDPFALYLKMMRRSGLQQEGSGLGLIRIRAETDMDVRCDVDGDVVTIIVEGQVAPPRSTQPTV
ncbi:MAG TPA: hypothetical protein VE987_01820 [Polyangiaceae bacterium]|nr:hypothetical protein [Polyangiaceae bacterium]